MLISVRRFIEYGLIAAGLSVAMIVVVHAVVR
jgi:Flp pilus assembly pilin Flp